MNKLLQWIIIMGPLLFSAIVIKNFWALIISGVWILGWMTILFLKKYKQLKEEYQRDMKVLERGQQ